MSDDTRVAIIKPEEVDDSTPDLFSPERRKDDQPSEGVYVDIGEEELAYVGEVQLPVPIPTDIIIETQGWLYTFTLTERQRSK